MLQTPEDSSWVWIMVLNFGCPLTSPVDTQELKDAGAVPQSN